MKMNCRGLTILELVAAMMISVLVILASGITMEFFSKASAKNSILANVFFVKNSILLGLQNPSSWRKIIWMNPPLACVMSRKCNPPTQSTFTDLVFTPSSDPNVYLIGAALTGFGQDGAYCNSFSLSESPRGCSMRFRLGYRLICQSSSDCSEVRIELKGDLEGQSELNFSPEQREYFSFVISAPDIRSFCPDNFSGFVRAPEPVENQLTYSLCVAQFEMKPSLASGTAVLDGRGTGLPLSISLHKAVSRPEGTPWTRISLLEARSACQALGTGARLLRNSEWDLLARDLASNPLNWGSGQLNSGNSDNAIDSDALANFWAYAPSKALISNGTDPYFGTGNSNGELFGSGGEQKRTHIFSNGEVIWDFAGNVREIVDVNGKGEGASYASGSAGSFDLNDTEITSLISSLSTASMGSFAADTFRPTNATWTHASQNIGKFNRNGGSQSNRILTRGGSFSTSSGAGLFSGDLTEDLSSRMDDGGFRCVIQF